MLDWLGCRSASRSAKFSVAVFKASRLDLLAGRSAKFGCTQFSRATMLNWWGGRSASRSAKFGVASIQGIYAPLTGSRSARFGVSVFKASILDWWGVDLPVDLLGLWIAWYSMHLRLNWLGLYLPSLVYQYSKHLCLIDWGVDLPVDLPSLVFQYSRHLCSIDLGVDQPVSSAKVWCSSIQGIYAPLMGVRPARFGVAVFRASMLN